MPSLTEIPLILGELLVLLVKLLFFFLEACYRLVVPPSRKDVAGKVVLITGAGHGMGRCTTKRFAKLQARVVIWDINEAGICHYRRGGGTFHSTSPSLTCL